MVDNGNVSRWVQGKMIKPSQDLPSDAEAMFDSLQRLLPRERNLETDRPQEREALDGEERIALAVRGRVARWGSRTLAALA